MNPPKIDICIEGYNTDQTDFYISYLIDKYNTCEQSYKNALNKISELEAENQRLRSDYLSLSQKIGGYALELEIIGRLKNIENLLGVKNTNDSQPHVHKTNSEINDFEEKLKDFKSLLNI